MGLSFCISKKVIFRERKGEEGLAAGEKRYLADSQQGHRHLPMSK
jgi:hypothetical protein